MGLIDDIKLYYSYKKTIKKNENELLTKFNIKIDNADRMYTVLNMPTEYFEEPYNLRKSDIDQISEKMITEYSIKLAEYLDSIGLREMYTFYGNVQKVEKYAYLLIIGFKRLDSVDYNTFLYRRFIPVVLGLTIIATTLFFIFM